jgi:AraC-like DNA-binding protein
MPRDKRLRTVCAALLHEPGRPETLDEWSNIAGASSRTLARLFASETRIRFVDRRYYARLADALARLARGQDVASVFHGLGYASASAFTAMLRKALGKTTRNYFTHSTG